MTEDNKYLPLFRKYRPQSFKDVIGQEFTTTALMNAIKLNKIANAYLFCGPRGTGKTSSARIFAKSLNCVNGPTVEPCQKCQSCLDVTNASGLDVIEIDAATNRGIDDAKELISKVQYAPMNGKYKIFIIDEVHMLSKEAFNALLKTFEEPPENVIFILATTEPHKVIETIVSRCQRFDFRRITIDDIVKKLKEISKLENINIQDEALFAIAKNVSGGMRDSLALLDQASILGLEKEITKETIEMLIGKLTFNVLYDLTNQVLSSEVEDAIKSVEKIYEKGSEPRNFVENYIEFLRNILLILNSKNDKITSELTLISEENIQKIKSNSLYTKEKLIEILDKVIDFYREIKTSTNPYLWAELMVISITSKRNNKEDESKPQAIAMAKPVIKAVEIKKEVITNIEHQPIEQKQPEASITKKTIEAKEETKEEVKQIIIEEKPAPQLSGESEPAKIWSEILNKIESIPAKFFYSGVGKLVNIDGSNITLGFVNQNAIAQAKADNKYNPLLKAIKLILGDSGNIEFITINEDTKIIDTKLNVKISSTPIQPVAQKTFNQEQPTEKINSSNEPVKEEAKEEEIDVTGYSQTTKDMLQTYSGRVVE